MKKDQEAHNKKALDELNAKLKQQEELAQKKIKDLNSEIAKLQNGSVDDKEKAKKLMEKVEIETKKIKDDADRKIKNLNDEHMR